MQANYFFIDGSALTAQVRQLRRAYPAFAGRKLCPKRFIDYFMFHLMDLHQGAFKRATFYFPKGDEGNVDSFLEIPDHKKPGEVKDIHFKFCGHKLKKSADFDAFVEKVVPAKFQSRFSKSEKGIDIEICCDALKLASTSKVDRVFLLTNDGDFIPFCRTIKEFGSNISIIHLSDVVPPNGELLYHSDSYDVVRKDRLGAMFIPVVNVDEPLLPDIELTSEKDTLETIGVNGELEDMAMDSPVLKEAGAGNPSPAPDSGQDDTQG